MIRVGIVGLGFMGRMHYRCWNALPGAKVTAICESNPKVLAAAGEATKGNVEGAADHIDLGGLAVHSDLGELLGEQVGRRPLDHPADLPAPGHDREGTRGGRSCPLREADGPERGRVRSDDRRGKEPPAGAPDRPLHPVLARVCRDPETDPGRRAWQADRRLVPPIFGHAHLEPR